MSTSCRSHADCDRTSAEPYCGEHGICVQCRDDEDCGGGPCSGGSCVECRVDEDCLSGSCNSRGRCDQCTTNTDCPIDRPFCQAAEGRRVCTECATHADCAEAFCSAAFCACHDQAFVCTDGCMGPADCAPPRALCGPGRYCIGCESDTDCPGDTFCDETECIFCRSDADCVADYPSCQRTYCYGPMGSLACRSGADCAAPSRCVLEAGSYRCAVPVP